jgi:RNA polymerase sigma-70 factor (ECF subfamily)
LSAAPQLDRVIRPADEQDEELQELFERYARPLERFCLRELGNREEAEDAVQTTFLNAFRAFRRGVRPELEAAWLYAIAANVCRSRRRSFFRRRRLECDDDLHALEDVLAAPQALEAEALIGLGDALAAMPESQRTAILLREWQGLSYAEISQELGITHAAVETLIFRARRTLAKGLEAEQPRSRRLVGGLNVGSLASALKGLLGGAGAAKLAAAGAVVVAASVAAVPIVHHVTPAPSKPAPKSGSARSDSVTPVAAVPHASVGSHPAAAATRQARVRGASHASAALGSVRRGAPVLPGRSGAAPGATRSADAHEDSPSVPGAGKSDVAPGHTDAPPPGYAKDEPAAGKGATPASGGNAPAGHAPQGGGASKGQGKTKDTAVAAPGNSDQHPADPTSAADTPATDASQPASQGQGQDNAKSDESNAGGNGNGNAGGNGNADSQSSADNGSNGHGHS